VRQSTTFARLATEGVADRVVCGELDVCALARMCTDCSRKHVSRPRVARTANARLVPRQKSTDPRYQCKPGSERQASTLLFTSLMISASQERERRTRRAMQARKSVRLDIPLADVYQFWRRFENPPRFMAHLERERGDTPTTSAASSVTARSRHLGSAIDDAYRLSVHTCVSLMSSDR